MSRRGAGLAKADGDEPELELLVTPALGRAVADCARRLIRDGARAPEVASLMAHAAARLAQQGQSRLSRDEWLTLCAVLWDGPEGDSLLTSPGGEA